MAVAKKRKAAPAWKTADRLFSLWVRRNGVCELAGPAVGPCKGGLQCCHGFSRRYRSVRWDERNAFAGCQAHHVFYTHRDLEWKSWMRERCGDELYDELWQLALRGPKPDIPAIVEDLKVRLAAIK